jgi:N-formylglutamate amidohydrolase
MVETKAFLEAEFDRTMLDENRDRRDNLSPIFV